MNKSNGAVIGERLVKAPEGSENDVGANYYSTSIRDGAHRYQQQQAHKRQRLVDPYYPDHGAIGPYTGPIIPSSQWTLRSNAPENHGCQIQALNFNMRIVSPGEERRTIDKALHVYTQLQGDQAGGAPTPLEEVGDWRFFFPRLAEITEEDRSRRIDCDIILLEASLQLMDTYPPRGSKLGIDLDLEYANPITRSVCLPEGLKKAFCITHFYDRHGDAIDCKQSDLPSIDNQSRVRAVFESGWWAKLLGNLTEKRLAAAQEDRDSINAADEEVRKCFRSLTAVQEVYGYGSDSNRPDGYGTDHHQNGSGNRRIAILLWKFRQTRPREVGTTSWRKLVPPPGRESLNSPGPLIETMNAAPLSMDALLMSSHHPSAQDPYQESHRHAAHGHSGSYMAQERDFASQPHADSSAPQHTEVPSAQWHGYPNMPVEGIDPEILSPLEIPNYDVLLSMNQQKDGGHGGQSRNSGGMNNTQIVQGLDGNFEAAIAGLDGINEVDVPNAPNRVASNQWSSNPNYTQSRMPSDTLRSAGHLDGRTDNQDDRMHRMHQDMSMQLARSEMERQRQHQVTPSQQPTPRLRTPFEGNQGQSNIFASTGSTHPEGPGQNALAFSHDLQNVGSHVEMDDNIQAFLDDMGSFDSEHQAGSRVDALRYQSQHQQLHQSGHPHPSQQRSMWQQSPTSLQGSGSFDQHYQSQAGPNRLYRTHSQSSQHPQVPSRPHSANVSASGSPHPHHQQARLVAAAKPQTRPLTPASMQSGRHFRPQGPMSIQTGQQAQQRAHEYAGGSANSPTAYGLSQSRPQSQQQQHYTLRSPLAEAGAGSQGGQGSASGELVDRLVDHVRAGVDGPHGLDGHDIPRVERRQPVLGEPWKGVDHDEHQSGDADAHSHHQRFDASNPGAMVGQIGAE